MLMCTDGSSYTKLHMRENKGKHVCVEGAQIQRQHSTRKGYTSVVPRKQKPSPGGSIRLHRTCLPWAQGKQNSTI